MYFKSDKRLIIDSHDEELNFMCQNCIYGVDLEIWFALATVLFVIVVFALRVIIGIFRGENVLDVLEKSLDDAVDFDYDDD